MPLTPVNMVTSRDQIKIQFHLISEVEETDVICIIIIASGSVIKSAIRLVLLTPKVCAVLQFHTENPQKMTKGIRLKSHMNMQNY